MLPRRSAVSGCLALWFLVVLAPSSVAGNGRISRRIPPQEYGTVIMDSRASAAGQRPVVFRHWVHRAAHTCRLCHVDLEFAMQAGLTEVRCDDLDNGRYCAACHNGREAFTGSADAQYNCPRCHVPGDPARDRTNRAAFEQLTATLPPGRFGNGVDWAAGSRAGTLNPRDYIKGISFQRLALANDEGEVNLDAKLTGLPDIVFSHREHATWNSCDLCHPDLFALKASATRFTMQEIFAGRYCGSCHGKVAFPLHDCGRCHSKPASSARP